MTANASSRSRCRLDILSSQFCPDSRRCQRAPLCGAFVRSSRCETATLDKIRATRQTAYLSPDLFVADWMHVQLCLWNRTRASRSYGQHMSIT